MTTPTELRTEISALQELAIDVVRRAKLAGADQADVGLNVDQGLSVNVRLGDVETIEHTLDRGLSLTVYVNQRKGSASSADLSPRSIIDTLEQAIAIARHTEADSCHGLADAARMAKQDPDLKLWFAHDLTPEAAIALGKRCEAAGLNADPRITNSEGAGVSASKSYSVYANSHGFVGVEAGTSYSMSASFVADAGDGLMERDYDYDAARDFAELKNAEAIGQRAAEKSLRRLQPRQLSTRTAKILLTPELTRGFVGHLTSAVAGGAQYRKSSFLLNAVGEKLLPDWCNWVETPHLERAFGSANFDAEGVATINQSLIEAGVLTRYVLGSYSARKLGLQSTGNAGGLHNLTVSSNAGGHAELLQAMGTGFWVTELMGQGVNGVTGDYSRGAAGFWVENGEICYPVSEVTIAGNLRKIYQDLIAIGNDVDRRGGIHTGSALLAPMTIAGS